MFFLCCTAAIGWTCFNAPWKAVLCDGESCYGMDFQIGPIWQSPALPTYSEFQKAFDLPAVPKHSARIEAVVCWMDMGERVIGAFWLISIVFEALCCLAPELRSNIVLMFVSAFARILAIAFGMSIVFWIVFGGWYPPSPFPFAFCGVVGWAIRRWLLHRQRSSP